MSVATARTHVHRCFVALLFVLAGSLGLVRGAAAQGVTTGAVRGVINDPQGQPVAGATLLLTGTQTGQRYQTTAQSSGHFYIANVQVGSYAIEARAIGYRPVRQTFELTLGQVVDLPITMQTATVELAPIVIAGEESPMPVLSPSHTGPRTSVSEQLISSLPSLNRNFTDFIQTVPQVNDNSIAGGTNRSNNIQIDGAVNNDLFSLNSSNGQPGGRSNAPPMSLDAIKEYQVQIAPYDIRFGGFTGGLVNAITKSGTNEFHGSLFGYVRSQALVGRDSLGLEAADFQNNQYGFTLGGPLVQNRLHFFIAAESRKDDRPFSLLQVGSDSSQIGTVPNSFRDSVGVGIRLPTLLAVQRIVRDSFGFDPGDYLNPTNSNPNQNLFVKLDGQLSEQHQFEVSYNRVHASINTLVHSPTATGFRDGYQLSNSGYNFKSDITSVRGRINSQLSGTLTNELIAGYSAYREPRAIAANVPLIFVGGDTSAGRVTNLKLNPAREIAVGGERFSQANILNQDIYELTDNVTLSRGRHVFTVGTHNEFFTFFNVFFPASNGVWAFADTNALLARSPYRYEIALPLIPGGPNVNWSVKQYGFYAQDVYSPTSRLNLTFGLRVDMPRLDQPLYNHTLDSVTAPAGSYVNGACASPTACGGINTANVPKQTLWSPRFGFSYDANGDGSTFVRGGIGVFTGRPPYVFVSNAYSNTGASQATLVCDGPFSGVSTDSVPTFTTDVTAQPQTCRGGASVSAPKPSVVYMDPNLQFPQTLRLSLGADRRMFWNIVGTVDLLYSRALNQFYLNDVNLVQGGTAFGEGNRPRYSGRLWSYANDVIVNTNSNQDYSWSATFQLQKRFSNRLEFTASYTRSQAKDLMSFGSDIANSNLRFSPLEGTLANRALRTSAFDVPDKIVIAATTELPRGVLFTLSYVGRSGYPFTYTVSNDANGDNLSGNDQVYVPYNAQDISLSNPAQWPSLDAFIRRQPCLDRQRGHIMERNSCRNPWQTFFNARIAKTFTTRGDQHLEISADIFNVLALLHLGGEVRSVGGSSFEAINMMSSSGYNATFGRSTYSISLPTLNFVSNFLSRYQIMLGAKYTF